MLSVVYEWLIKVKQGIWTWALEIKSGGVKVDKSQENI